MTCSTLWKSTQNLPIAQQMSKHAQQLTPLLVRGGAVLALIPPVHPKWALACWFCHELCVNGLGLFSPSPLASLQTSVWDVCLVTSIGLIFNWAWQSCLLIGQWIPLYLMSSLLCLYLYQTFNLGFLFVLPVLFLSFHLFCLLWIIIYYGIYKEIILLCILK